MTTMVKKEIFKEHLEEWLACKGDRKKRGKLTKAIARTAKVHRKSVPRSFKRAQTQDHSQPESRGRAVFYTKDVDLALYCIWEAANRICGELLHPVIREYVQILARDGMWGHGIETTEKLFLMSKMTVRRRVSGFQKKYGILRGKSTTRASELKKIIPIFKGPWESLPPGNGQLDTVAHCGDSIAGNFVYTVNFTDAATYWGVRRGQWNKGHEATKRSLGFIKKKLPFPWIMGHPDTGSEFINWINKEWCEDNGITLTRSEPGKKNDNMYVEERNGHVVRKYLGWERLDANPGIVDFVNAYYDILDLYLNHFQPVRRTRTKERIGSKYKRTFESVAKTPYQRLMAHPALSEEIKRAVQKEHQQLNPLMLKKKLDTLKEKIFGYQKKRGLGNQ